MVSGGRVPGKPFGNSESATGLVQPISGIAELNNCFCRRMQSAPVQAP